MQPVTPAQQAVHHALQDPVTLPPDQAELPTLRALVATLTQERDAALQELNDRANVQVAWDSLTQTVREAGTLVTHLRILQMNLLRLRKAGRR